MKKTILLFFALITLLSGVSRETHYEVLKILKAYQDAFNTGDVRKLSPYFADSFSFMGMVPDVSKNLFAYFVQSGIYTIDEFFNVEIDGKDTIKVRFLAVHNQYEVVFDTLVCNMTFISTGRGLKILSISQPEEPKFKHWSEKVRLPIPIPDIKYSGPIVYSANLIKKGEIMLVKARLGEKLDGYLILDSGAPTTVIDKKYAQDLPKAEGSFGALAVGISGEEGAVELVSIPSLSIGQFTFSELLGATMDFSHISEALDEDIMGILGADIIANFETIWDLRNNRITFVSLSQDGGSVVQPEEIGLMPSNYVAGETAMNIAHFLAFPCDAGGKNLRLILDTGAGAGLLTEEAIKKLPKYSVEHLDSTDSLIGATPDAQIVRLVRIPKLVGLGVHKPDYTFAVGQLDKFKQYGIDLSTVDGLIGSNFFDNYVLVLNYKKGTIKVYR